MTAPTMPAEAAAWIREHAWTARMRKTYAEVPGFYTTCACQWGRSIHCGRGRHGKCAVGTPLRDYAALIVFDGGRPAFFPEPYTHKTDASATGPKFTQLAQVWLADRVCRWVCSCGCHTAPAALELESVQGSLFEVAACL